MQLMSRDEWNTGEYRSFEYRCGYVRRLGWFILTQETAAVLANYLKGKRTIEVFAGTGHLARSMRALGGLERDMYRAYDNGEMKNFYTQSNPKGVTRKNAFLGPIKKADVIVMTWPMYDTNDAARIAAKMVPGQILVYNGESAGGCTGDDKFFEILEEKFTVMKFITDQLNENHVRFQGINDAWCVYRKDYV